MGLQKDIHLSNDQFFNCLLIFCMLTHMLQSAKEN
jgi:hypothetical protein